MLWCALTPVSPGRHCSSTPDCPGLDDWHVLACWAGNYTPQVSLDTAAPALFFEISGSLRLFGGLQGLLARVRRDLQSFPWTLSLAVAPVARAGMWLALAGSPSAHADLAGMQVALRQVPLPVLPWPDSVQARVQGFGFRRVGDLSDLPRGALARRIGREPVLDLARALGELADPMPWFAFPQRFVHALELPAPVDSAPALLFAASRLAGALSGWLAVRMAAASVLDWELDHGREQPPTRLPLRFSEPVHALPRIERVLKEALARLPLPAPVLGLRLSVQAPLPRDARTQALFAGSYEQGGENGLPDLLDRLHARLGEGAVRRLAGHADHRPERATIEYPAAGWDGWARQAPGQASKKSGVSIKDAGSRQRVADAGGTAVPAPLRPLCLLEQPVALAEHHGQPWRGGALRLLSGPERIESGWWDGDDAVRDYFLAEDKQHCWLWVFRSGGNAPRWFLHGMFS